MDIRELQRDRDAWAAHNYPGISREAMVLKLAEEVGELARAAFRLATKTGGDFEQRVAIRDAVADVVITAIRDASAYGVDADDEVVLAWEQVKRRDWRADPLKGRAQ